MDFDVPAGACLLVIGPSGSGKSTLALALAGLVPRDLPGTWTGSLTVDGVETRDFGAGALAARVGLVFQDPSRQIVMERVEDDVAFGLEGRGWAREAMHARVPEALRAVALDGAERQFARDLSGGQQQRLALAGVLAPRPGFLVLDEPTANLDPAAARAFLARLAAVRDERSATIVIIEHRVEDAWPLADVILALGSDGAPIAFGTPETVLRDRDRLDDAGIWLPGTVTKPLARPSESRSAGGVSGLVSGRSRHRGCGRRLRVRARPPGPARREPRGPTGRADRPGGTQWRRQVHAGATARRPADPGRRDDLAAR
ncbi:MAG: ATP-binding cassette domain-containing protein [Candidatus Limnocylindrales bacterium]